MQLIMKVMTLSSELRSAAVRNKDDPAQLAAKMEDVARQLMDLATVAAPAWGELTHIIKALEKGEAP